jgi:hypothetical protein
MLLETRLEGKSVAELWRRSLQSVDHQSKGQGIVNKFLNLKDLNLKGTISFRN